MWYWLSPILFIVHIGMAFISGPIYIRLTQHRMGADDFIGYTIAAVAWPVCLPGCLIFHGARSTETLWNKYAKFLEDYYKKTHNVKDIEPPVRDYY
jgi:hypothetical protein